MFLRQLSTMWEKKKKLQNGELKACERAWFSQWVLDTMLSPTTFFITQWQVSWFQLPGSTGSIYTLKISEGELSLLFPWGSEGEVKLSFISTCLKLSSVITFLHKSSSGQIFSTQKTLRSDCQGRKFWSFSVLKTSDCQTFYSWFLNI